MGALRWFRRWAYNTQQYCLIVYCSTDKKILQMNGVEVYVLRQLTCSCLLYHC